MSNHNIYSSILIANRGEIAMRLLKSLSAISRKIYLIYERVEKVENNLPHTRCDEFDKVILSKKWNLINPSVEIKCICLNDFLNDNDNNNNNNLTLYLNTNLILNICKFYKVEAVHPGYGFLSENFEFAHLLSVNNIKFIGPRKDLLELFGNKMLTRKTAIDAPIKVSKGCDLKDNNNVETILSKQRFPIMLKSVYGGGGKGMRICHNVNEAILSFKRVKSESLKAFGKDDIFCEELIQDAKHIEIQVVCDQFENVIHLFERDCSVQTERHQKFIEVCPSIQTEDVQFNQILKELYNASINLCKFVKYDFIGTIEFLVYKNKEEMYDYIFLEVNPRIQVEHTITEEVVVSSSCNKIDVVLLSALIAKKFTLSECWNLMDSIFNFSTLKKMNHLSQQDVFLKPHTFSIQLRLNLRDLNLNKLIEFGVKIEKNKFDAIKSFFTSIKFNEKFFIRIDSGIDEFTKSINPKYDPLILKIILTTSNSSFSELSSFCSYFLTKVLVVNNIDCNVNEMSKVLLHSDFVSGKLTTQSKIHSLKENVSNKEDINSVVTIRAPTTGKIVEINEKIFSNSKTILDANEVLLVLESMKMETDVLSPHKGNFSLTINPNKIKPDLVLNEGEEIGKLCIVLTEKTTTTEKEEKESEEYTTSSSMLRNIDDNINIPSHPLWQTQDELKNILTLASGAIYDLNEGEHLVSNHTDRFQFIFSNVDFATIRKSNDALKKMTAHHLNKQKLLPRQRIKQLIDPHTKFLEIGSFAGINLYNKQSVLSGGCCCGIGIVEGVACMILVNDGSIYGGSVYPITLKKQMRAQQIAIENKLPCIYIVDSGGAYLPLQSEIFPEVGGSIFKNQAQMSANHIPQFAAVVGMCTAGGAYVPAMCDEVVMVKENGTVYLGGPPLVKAATGEVVNAQDLGGATMHSSISGTSDYAVDTEVEALNRIRMMVKSSVISSSSDFCVDEYGKDSTNVNSVKIPVSFPYKINNKQSSILNLIPTKNSKIKMKNIIDSIFVDIVEFKPLYGVNIICAFASVFGYKVGVIGNNGPLDSTSALKSTHFIQLCDYRNLPIIFLQNITGFMVGRKYEEGGITKNGSKMVRAVSNARVPKITIIVGGSFGAGNYGMCGRAYDPRFLFMWPNAEIAVMGGEQAANVLVDINKGKRSDTDLSKMKETMIAKFKLESSSLYSSAHLWDDGIIDPRETGTVIALCLSVIRNNIQHPLKGSYGVFRM